jgi:DNA-binding MarR family transcriptional regulator
MLQAELIDFGLSAREAKIYLVMLSMGDAPASAIAKRAGLSRLKVYSTLESLHKRGLVSFYEKRRMRFYSVSPPQSFLRHCDDQITTIQAKRIKLERLLPQLEAYSGRGDGMENPMGRIRFIRDRVLFQNKCVNALKKANEWRISHDGSLWSLIASIQPKTSHTPQCLVPLTEKKKLSKYIQRIEARYLLNAQISGPMNFMIMGSTVMFVVEDGIEFSAIEIENQEVSKTLGTLFLFLWKMERFEG